MQDYIRRIRRKLGHDRFIHPAARIIVESPEGRILVIERTDNGQMGLPAGALEEGETIEGCIIREVREETGLIIRQPILIGLSTDPKREFVEYPNGDQLQYFTAEFYTDTWEGEIGVRDTDEIRRAAFADRDSVLAALPHNELSTFDSLDHFRRTGQVMLK